MSPKKLYKYRTCDKFTKRMIKDGQLYLCPANELDDQFDCAVSFVKEKILSMTKKEMLEYSSNIVGKYLKQFLPVEVLQIVMNSIKEKGFNTENFLLFACDKDEINENKVTYAFNQFDNAIKTAMQKLESNQSFKDEMLKMLELQVNVGICSLAERKDNQVMWNMYSHNYEGYCIEYEVDDLIDKSNNSLYKVSYSNKKEFDPIAAIITEAVNQLFLQLLNLNNESELQKKIEKVLLTKHSNWRFQKEWRIIGNPKSELIGCKITAIYLGKNIKEKDEKEIVELARLKHIKVHKLYDDYESLSIKFKRVIIESKKT